MSVRDETVADLLFLDQTAEGNPSEEGIVRLVSGDLVGFVGGSVKSLTQGGSGITPTEHQDLDQLVHSIEEDSYEDYTYGLFGRLDNVTIWTDSGQTVKIRETQFTYTGLRVTQVVTIQYDAAGLEVERVTETINYAFPFGNRVANIDRVRTP